MRNALLQHCAVAGSAARRNTAWRSRLAKLQQAGPMRKALLQQCAVVGSAPRRHTAQRNRAAKLRQAGAMHTVQHDAQAMQHRSRNQQDVLA